MKCLTLANAGPLAPAANPQLRNAVRVITKMLFCVSALIAVSYLTGCSSLSSKAASDPYGYNPRTGYPAVGGSFPP